MVHTHSFPFQSVCNLLLSINHRGENSVDRLLFSRGVCHGAGVVLFLSSISFFIITHSFMHSVIAKLLISSDVISARARPGVSESGSAPAARPAQPGPGAQAVSLNPSGPGSTAVFPTGSRLHSSLAPSLSLSPPPPPQKKLPPSFCGPSNTCRPLDISLPPPSPAKGNGPWCPPSVGSR